MLERELSLRSRNSQINEEGDDDDESKTRKNISFATRATNHITKIGFLWPCVIFFLFLLIVSLLLHTRNLACVPSSSSPFYSRFNFFGIDGLDSDFGILGVPWCRSKHGNTVEWTNKDLIKGLEEFVPIYETRPIKNNMYGMGFDHSFGLWFIARWIKPELMIESGAFKGHSTWVLRQAMPDTRILSITPRHPEKYLKKGAAYVDGNCTYFAGKDFVDFGSVDWKSVLKKHRVTDRSRVLVFFDDHQNELKRLKQALKAGFRHLVFEDNYDTGTGDHYSFRQICDQFYIRAPIPDPASEAGFTAEAKKVIRFSSLHPCTRRQFLRGQMGDSVDHLFPDSLTCKTHSSPMAKGDLPPVPTMSRKRKAVPPTGPSKNSWSAVGASGSGSPATGSAPQSSSLTLVSNISPSTTPNSDSQAVGVMTTQPLSAGPSVPSGSNQGSTVFGFRVPRVTDSSVLWKPIFKDLSGRLLTISHTGRECSSVAGLIQNNIRLPKDVDFMEQ